MTWGGGSDTVIYRINKEELVGTSKIKDKDLVDKCTTYILYKKAIELVGNSSK